MMMVLWQSGSWLSGLGLNVSIELVVDSIFGQMRVMMLLLWLSDRSSCNWLWFGGSELLLDLQVRVDCIHAEVEIGAVLLVILGANMRTSFFSWCENVARSATLDGHDSS